LIGEGGRCEVEYKRHEVGCYIQHSIPSNLHSNIHSACPHLQRPIPILPGRTVHILTLIALHILTPASINQHSHIPRNIKRNIGRIRNIELHKPRRRIIREIRQQRIRRHIADVIGAVGPALRGDVVDSDGELWGGGRGEQQFGWHGFVEEGGWGAGEAGVRGGVGWVGVGQLDGDGEVAGADGVDVPDLEVTDLVGGEGDWGGDEGG
jgi:hypothetical protein